MRYDPYEPLIAPARPTASLRLLVTGVVLTVLGYIVLVYLLSFLLAALVPGGAWTALSEDLDTARAPAGVLVNLFVFGLLIAALAFTLRALHQRDLLSLIGNLPRTWHQFRRVGIALLILFAVTAIMPLPDDLALSANLPFGRWLTLLPLALLGLLIQTSAEELGFRGYLQSQLAARFPHPLVWIGAPSVLFGVLHYDPSLPFANAAVVVIWATLFGLAAADLTARSGTLGPAIALHMVNNFSAIAIAAPEGAFDGLALYTFPFSLASGDALIVWAPVDLMILLCSWLTARLALRR